jgi:hypothetical protein
MPNETTTEAGRPNRGGRPRKDYSSLVGTTRNFLLIDRIFRAGGASEFARLNWPTSLI